MKYYVITKETTTPPITEMPEENVTPQYTNEQVIHQELLKQKCLLRMMMLQNLV